MSTNPRTWNLIVSLLLIAGSLTAASLEQVNTTSSQTLTNKTLTAPTISSPTISSPTFSGTTTGTYTIGGTPTLSSPILSGTVTGTYTIGGTPTLSSPVLSGTATGTYTLGGTPTITNPTISGASIASSTITSGTLAGTTNLTGGQITFPATQNASSNANTLDDYEEGNCTVTLGGTATYTNQICRYTKIGRAVTVHVNLTVNTIGTGSTNTITFGTAPAVATSGWGVGAARWSSGAASPVNLNAYASPGTSTFIMVGNSAAAAADAAINIFGNGTDVKFSLTYMSS